MAIAPSDDVVRTAYGIPSRSRPVWRRFRRNRLAVGGLALVVVLAAAAVLAPVLAPTGPDITHFNLALHPPGPGHWLGTDDLGRDVLSRVLYGARESLASGLLVVCAAALMGVPLGLTAGYRGGWIDEIVMRVMDAWLAFPGLVLALAIAWILGASLSNAIIAIAVVSVPGYARIARGQALALRHREFVESARAAGASTARIVIRHILVNAATPLVVVATLNIGTAILSIAALSFLGLGPPPPAPDWGAMVEEGSQYLNIAPWISLFPGLAMFGAVMGFTMLGDGLRDVLDPRS
jgi:peptide/nickel transport system permease protein